MSTLTNEPTIDTTRPPIPFGREVLVEVRKMFDTRGGLWLFIITGGLIALAMGLTLLVVGLNEDVTITASGFSDVMTIPVSILVPIFAILTVSSEWSQRTHLTTFTLQPNRGRVVGAKFVAVTLLAIGTIVLAIALGALGNVVYGLITDHDVVWNVSGKQLFWTIVLQLVFFWMAFALATLLLNTPATIAVFYVVALILPIMVYPVLIFVFGWARDLLPWLDFNYAAMPLIDGEDFVGDAVDVSALEYVRFAFAIFLWVVVPGVLGYLRIQRTEVK
jgi:ABC-2 type transport system permease protein